MNTAPLAIHPGLLLKQELERRNITIDHFIKMSGMGKPHLYQLFKGEGYLSHYNAFQIAQALRMEKESWLQAQINYDYSQEAFNVKSIHHGTP